MKPFHLALLAALALLLCHALTIRGMFGQWTSDEDMGHGLLVPIVMLWIIWHERSAWRTLPLRPSLWGFAILAAGAAMHTVATLGGGLFAASVAFLLSIVGVVVALAGWAWLRAWAFPLGLGVFMLPKLAIVYNQATLPLQLLASRMAAFLLTTTGYGVVRDGNILEVRGHQILVAEACNGVRFLLPLAFIAVVLGYLTKSKPWVRWALLLMTAPLAIAANAVRVAFSGAVPAWAEGNAHAVLGVIIFLMSLALLAAAQHALQSADSHA